MTTRRSFLQSMAAMFALPSVAVFSADYGIKKYDFAPWVDAYSTRFDLSKPFDWNGFTIATDGRKLIRVPMVESSTADNPRKAPNVEGLPWDTFNSDGWKPFDPYRVPMKEATCANCCGIGWVGNPEWRQFDVRTAPEVYQRRFIHETCMDLELEDYTEARMELDKRIGWMTTAWVGSALCDVCDGSGHDEFGFGIKIDDARYDGGYIAAIQRLGDFETKLEDYETNCYGKMETHKLLLFRGNGFDGMVMPRATY